MIKHIAFVAYPAADVTRTRMWYEQKLGLTFAGPYEEDGIEKYNEAHLGEACFSLMWPQWAGQTAGSAAGVAFEVDDIDAAVQSLRNDGVAIVNTFDGPSCRQATIRDPEGNTIVLHQKTGR